MYKKNLFEYMFLYIKIYTKKMHCKFFAIYFFLILLMYNILHCHVILMLVFLSYDDL
jgi:hypothetical protein